MEAARIASLKGHAVTLFEQQRVLGGQLLAASAPQFKQPIRDFMEYLKIQVKKQGVKLQLGKKVTPAVIKRLKPDVVVIATGATHCIPNIPGAEGDNVATASDILLGKKNAGEEAVIIGGGVVGSELAWFLAEQGKKVTIVEMLGAVAMDMNMFSRLYLLDKLGELGVNMVIETTAKKITNEGVIAMDAEGKEQVIKADTVILAAGFKCNNPLEKRLKGMVPKVYVIGDCVKPGKIEGAIGAAWRVARQI
jgi:2-enoate reductase